MSFAFDAFYNFRCGEIFFSHNQIDFLFICKFCDSHFDKFEKFASHKAKCFPKKESIFLVDIIKTMESSNLKSEAASQKYSHEPRVTANSLSALESLTFGQNEKEIGTENPLGLIEEITIEAETNLVKSEMYDNEYGFDESHQNIDVAYESMEIDETSKKLEKSGISKSKSLSRKKRLSLNPRPYECNQCMHSFSTVQLLASHKERIHIGVDDNPTKIKPFTCSICSKNFTRFDSLKGHKLTQHNAEATEEEQMFDKKPYKCIECNAGFPGNSDLRVHVRTHTGDRPFKCEDCGKGFTSISYLGIHLRSHSNEKLYCCEICSKTYAQKSGLVKHKRTHTGERPYKCKYCGKAFYGSGPRNNHEKTLHSLEYTQEQEKKKTRTKDNFFKNNQS